MKNLFVNFLSYLYDPRFQLLYRLTFGMGILATCLDSFAAGSDILQGTDESLWATMNGTGKKYIYAVEGIVALAAFIKTKNLLMFGGIIAVAIFMNIILSIAGRSV